MIAYSGPFWPFFLHVLGAMTLFVGILTAVVLSIVGLRDARPFLRAATFLALLSCIPDYVVMRIGAQWTYNNEGWKHAKPQPTWLGIGFGVADMGVIVLLLAIGGAYWWRRSGNTIAGRAVAGLSGLYMAMLAVAWLAMSGKWG